MRQFLVDEFSKFKIEVVELIQYVSKFKTLTMNVQTYLSINVLVLLGIEANIFMFSIPFDKTYNQEYYNILFYVGHTLYILFVCITNYMRLNVNDTLRMYKNDDIRMYNFDCITDTIVEVITTCNTYTLLTVHLL